MDLIQNLSDRFKKLHPQGLKKPNGETTKKLKKILTDEGYGDDAALTIVRYWLTANGVEGYKLPAPKDGKTHLDMARALLNEHDPNKGDGDSDGDEDEGEIKWVKVPNGRLTRKDVLDKQREADRKLIEDVKISNEPKLDTQQKLNLNSAMNDVLPALGHRPNSEVGKTIKKMVRNEVQHDPDLIKAFKEATPKEKGANLSELKKAVKTMLQKKL
jgi:hypothetical protein